MYSDIDSLCVNTIRCLSIDAIEKAKSGHPGMPLGAAGIGYVIFTTFLRHNPKNPQWPDRDRFILSAGHGSMLLYSLLHLCGYDVSLEDIKAFRQWGSKTPGHPEFGLTPGVETTTGPLGQGFANGVGMAMAERYLASYFNRPGFPIVDHWTYGIVSDGDLMEGISHEAASLAGHLKLGKIIYLYDSNAISIEGPTKITFTEDVKRRFEAYHWHVLEVKDGNDLDSIHDAILKAKEDTFRPSLIIVNTHIGYGSPNKQDSAEAHGEPLGTEEAILTKRILGCSENKEFFVPHSVYEHMEQVKEKGEKLESQWRKLFQSYKKEYPDLALEWERWEKNEIDPKSLELAPSYGPDPKGIATRVASGKMINHLSKMAKNILGGSADLAPSNKTLIEDEKDFQFPDYKGRNIRFGVREHAMGAILNGMALHGGLIPYGGTFLIFSDYMRPAIRMAAMMGLKVVYVFSHDSIGLGEDGPTHQPVEQLLGLRSIPNLTVIRPCDANETIEAWKVALSEIKGPVAICLTRQAVPILDRNIYAPARLLALGAYVLKETDLPLSVIIVATGSEVHLAIKVKELLEQEGVGARVVSMPSWELFLKQPKEYQKEVFGPNVLKVAIEAGRGLGWERIVGLDGMIISIERFGASAPYKVLYEKFGFVPEDICRKILDKLKGEVLKGEKLEGFKGI